VVGGRKGKGKKLRSGAGGLKKTKNIKQWKKKGNACPLGGKKRKSSRSRNQIGEVAPQLDQQKEERKKGGT